MAKVKSGLRKCFILLLLLSLIGGQLSFASPDFSPDNSVLPLPEFPDSSAISDMLIPVPILPQRIAELPFRSFPEDSLFILHIDSLLNCYDNPDSTFVLNAEILKERADLYLLDSLFRYRPEANFYGNDSLVFLISGGDYRDTLVQRLEILPVNDAPQWKSTYFRIPDFPEDQILRLPFSWLYERAEDIETPDTLLKFHARSGREVHISLEGGSITLVPNENWFGDDTLMLIVSDGELSDTAFLALTIIPVNDPPVLHPLPALVMNEDDTLFIERTLLESFAVDIETPREELKWQAQRLGKIRAFYDGMRIRITAAEDWYGTDSVRITVSDGELDASRNWLIHFNPINDPPVLRALPQQSLLEDDTLRLPKRELYRMAHDPETRARDLHWSLTPSPELQILEKEHSYQIFAAPDWYGRAGIGVSVSDGEYSDSSFMQIRVISVNDAPVLQPIPAQAWNEDDTLRLSRSYLNRFASDVETRSEDLLWTFLAEPPLFVRSNANEVKFSAAADWNGKGQIVAVISDGGLRDTAYIDVTIRPVNDAPRWLALPDTHMVEDKHWVLPLSFVRRFVYDPDEGDPIHLQISAGDKFFIEEKGDTLIFWPEQDWFGTEQLFLTASDGKKSSKIVWNIPVLPVNDAPYFTTLLPDSLSFFANNSDTLFMKKIVYDIDNDFKDMTWEITPGRIVRYLINDKLGAIIFFTENYRHGKDAVTIRVSDGHDMIVYYMPVYVHEVDRFLVANPEKLELLPNSPNPFREYTDIRYSLPVGCHVSIRIYNLLGKEIKELVNGYHEASNYSLRWYGDNESNVPAPSGVYLCRMDALVEGEPRVLMRKMMLVR